MAFDEVSFPKELIAFGSQGGPGHQTKITETDSGHEERVGRWSYPRFRFRVGLLERSNTELADIRTFAIARAGALRGFRLKDHNDFTSASDGTSAYDAADVQIGVGDGSTVAFQLVKKYTSGLSTITRTIVKPVEDTVTLEVDGVPQNPVNYAVDHTTGIVTFLSAPANTAVITAGFEFDVPVRFSEDVDDWLASTREDVDSNQISSLEMVELFDPSMTVTDRPYLGDVVKVLRQNIVLSLLVGHTYIIDPQVASLAVMTPSPTGMPTGGELWTVINVGANSIEVRDHTSTVLATLATDEAVDIHLSEDGAGGYVWYAF